MDRTLSLLLAPIAVVLVLCGVASAQTVITAPDGTISVEMSNVPLASALRALSGIASFQVLAFDRDAESLPVTVRLTQATALQALVKILDSAGVNYVLTAGPDGRRGRLVVSRRGVAVVNERVMDEPLPRVQNPAEGQPSDDKIIEAVHAAESDAREKALQQTIVVLPPPNPRAVGFVELPFPRPDGSPQIVLLPPPGANVVSPLPGASAAPQPVPASTAPQPGPTPPGSPTPGFAPRLPTPPPQPVDPQLQQLIDALVRSQRAK